MPFPCVPWQIQGNNVDYVVEVDSIGDPAKIVSGTTRDHARARTGCCIAEYVARFLRDAGIMRDGFSFQAGAGGIALAFVAFLREHDARSAASRPASSAAARRSYLVEMLQEGLTDYILDGQTFDLDGVRSIAADPRHVATSPFTSYNYHGKGNFASMVDAVVLGATEVDVHFNANVVTHSDGRLLHGIGGWQNCLFAGCTILAVPSFRDRIPVIVDEVTTLIGPGRADRRRGHRARHRDQSAPAGPARRAGRIGPADPSDRARSRPRSSRSAAASRSARACSIGRWPSSSGWTGRVLDTVWQLGT